MPKTKYYCKLCKVRLVSRNGDTCADCNKHTDKLTEDLRKKLKR